MAFSNVILNAGAWSTLDVVGTLLATTVTIAARDYSGINSTGTIVAFFPIIDESLGTFRNRSNVKSILP